MPAFPAGFSDLASVTASTKFLADNGSANGLGSAAQIRSYMLGLANAWSANGAASTPPVSLTGTWFTGGTATTTKPQFLVEPAGTTSTGWSTSGTGIGVNANSAFAGNLIDLQVNSSRKFSVDAYAYAVFGYSSMTIGNSSSARDFIVNSNGVQQKANAYIAWGVGASDAGGAQDLVLVRDATNTFAQRNGTNAQTFRLYGTFTNASEHRRLQIGSSTLGVFHIRPEGAGTGASGNVLHISGLPTSNPGPGILWNNAGSVAIGT